MDRRDLLLGLGIAAAGSRLEAKEPVRPAAPPSPVRDQLLVNRPRATAVMEEYGLVGLVALDPLNVYYLSNTWGVGEKLRREYPAFATLPRDPAEPGFLIASPLDALEIANGERAVPPLIVMAQAQNWQDYVHATPERLHVEPTPAAQRMPVQAHGPFTAREQAWIAAQDNRMAHAGVGPAWAIARALKESGMTKGKIGVDDMRIAYLLQQIGMDVECVPAYRIFQKIRMVKTAPELALMRTAGENNAIATMNTIRAIERGMTFAEIEQRFRAEAAARGNEMLSFIAGISLAAFPDGKTVPGKPFLIDAVSHFHQYNGDFGRAVVIGEPSRELLAREKGHRIGRDAIMEIVKPGVRFSELRRVGMDAMVKAGLPANIVSVAPHSVGLQHTDNPPNMDAAVDAPFDYVLEENMVITIDLPIVEIGWGGCHYEDMIRITRTGFEHFGAPGDTLVIV